MNWKIGLDRWLTTDPYESRDSYDEEVINALPNNFWNNHEDWVLKSETCGNWINKLYNKSVDPKLAAKMVERAFYLYER